MGFFSSCADLCFANLTVCNIDFFPFPISFQGTYGPELGHTYFAEACILYRVHFTNEGVSRFPMGGEIAATATCSIQVRITVWEGSMGLGLFACSSLIFTLRLGRGAREYYTHPKLLSIA
jgi:hypothetical protein